MSVATSRAPVDDSLEIEGRQFHVPAVRWGVRPDERLAAAEFGGGANRFAGETTRYLCEPASVDLSLVATGRCPLLLEHAYSLDCLIGAVVTARPEDGRMRALVRFARGGEAERIWGMLSEIFPLSLSIGARVESAVRIGEGPGAHFLATRWKLVELSVVVFGRDETAGLRPIDDERDVANWYRRSMSLDEDQDRLAVRHSLRTDRWQQWAFWRGGPRLAERFKLDSVEFSEALKEEVGRHAVELEEKLVA